MAHQPFNPDEPTRYRICLQGVVEAGWLEMLSGAWIIRNHNGVPKGVTVLVGWVADQAALVGDLEQLYNLGLPLVAVEYLSASAANKVTLYPCESLTSLLEF